MSARLRAGPGKVWALRVKVRMCFERMCDSQRHFLVEWLGIDRQTDGHALLVEAARYAHTAQIQHVADGGVAQVFPVPERITVRVRIDGRESWAPSLNARGLRNFTDSSSFEIHPP